MMNRAALILGALVVLSGCADRDAVMGRTAGTPVPEPQKVHCDLIFPGTDRR